MHILIDLLVLLIIGLAAWRGYKKGIIVGICGILALILSIYGANLISSAYYSEYKQILDPFVSGYVETSENLVTGTAASGSGSSSKTSSVIVTLTDAEKKDVFSVTYATMRQCGVAATPAEKIAREFGSNYTEVNYDYVKAMGDYLTDRVTFVTLFAAIFALLIILFTVIENVLNLTFTMPGIEKVDKWAGVGIGCCRAVLLMLVIGCVCRYLGLFIGVSQINKTVLLRLFINSNAVANLIGV